MDYEYVALVDQPRYGVYWDDLVAEGWCEWMKIPFWTRPDRCGPGPSYVYIMRRSKDEPQKYFHNQHCLCDECAKKRDVPRLWTEREIQELIYIAQWKVRAEKG